MPPPLVVTIYSPLPSSSGSFIYFFVSIHLPIQHLCCKRNKKYVIFCDWLLSFTINFLILFIQFGACVSSSLYFTTELYFLYGYKTFKNFFLSVDGSLFRLYPLFHVMNNAAVIYTQKLLSGHHNMYFIYVFVSCLAPSVRR